MTTIYVGPKGPYEVDLPSTVQTAEEAAQIAKENRAAYRAPGRPMSMQFGSSDMGDFDEPVSDGRFLLSINQPQGRHRPQRRR